MINLLPHHRFHIPNSLALFAAFILIVSSVVGFETNQEAYSSGPENGHSMKTDSSETGSISDTVEHKSNGLNIGSLLFHRG
jgi:hypothetical protein